MLPEFKAGRLRNLDRAHRAHARRAREHDALPLAYRQAVRVEARERMRQRARNVPGRELVRLAHVHEHERALGETLLDLVEIEVDHWRLRSRHPVSCSTPGLTAT